ncbi:hypothetical protein ACJIZ3_025101 [Penstemon smallii]|uniref:BHLH domain-containing protein n=1 Tax=Penstemon smallii TaxID=265156 RepID=A0ABD3TUN9_9LAMI
MGSEENGERVPFYGSNWDPIGSLNQSGIYGNSSQNEFVNPHLVQFPSDSNLVDMVLKNPSFGSGSFSEIVGSFGHSNFAQSNGIGGQRAITNVTNSQERCLNSEDGVLGASPNGKRKRKVPKNAEEEDDGDGDDDEKKQIFEQNSGSNSRSKPTGKQVNDNSNGNAEPSKENYIHMRAKRGQATNSHSLAERVRREKISERMRLLQELVPGCNKITGKAVMLDEIINYVQSLQQQVEFLSMKLATVNPELNVDIERVLSKDILHSRGNNVNAIGNGLALSSSHPFPGGYPQGTFNATTSPFHPLPQNLWNNTELQSILQMGFDSNPSVSSLGPNVLSKMEL